MLGIFSCFCCHLLTFLKFTFSKNYLGNTIRASNGLDVLSALIWGQTVCKGYHQLTKIAGADEELKSTKFALTGLTLAQNLL